MIYFISNLVEEELFNNLYNQKIKPGQQSQKFNRLFVKGIIKNNISIKCLSSIPASRYLLNKTFLKIKNSQNFTYQFLINIPGLMNICYIITSFLYAMKNIKRNDICIIDCLSVNNGYGISLSKKIKHFKTVSLITDFPEFVTSSKLFNNLSYKIINSSDGYIVLTKEMYERLNTNKPYCVVEGMCDIDQINISDKDYKKENVILFAGSLDKANGIENLVDAFIKINRRDYCLEIYGNGDYDKYLAEISSKNENIKFLGVKENKYIVERLKQVKLLVNPRPTDKEFTKYSFPSKTLEYMSSGTPFISSKLKGIGKEYDEYLTYFNSTDSDGIKNGLDNCLDHYEEMQTKAVSAKDFVLNKKNNVIQTKKIIDLLESIK